MLKVLIQPCAASVHEQNDNNDNILNNNTYLSLEFEEHVKVLIIIN